MCVDEGAAGRASRIADRLGIEGDPVLSRNGWSNHVWLYREAVIRLAARVGCGSLAVEAEIVPRLPAAVGYPRILGTGMIDGYEWMALERLPGDNLAAVWESLRPEQRSLAVTDLLTRLGKVPDTDVTGLSLPPTPLYAFEPKLIERQLTTARMIAGDAVAALAARMIRTGMEATGLIGSGLVHTDAVLSNAIWTGTAAIPIDFEFGCIGPIDLDTDCVGREVMDRGDPDAISGLYAALHPILERPGAMDRLRAYAVLRDLWAIGKWVDHDPTLEHAANWEPVRSLIADTRGGTWVDRLIAARG